MKLIAINGSLRSEGGLTQKIIDSVFEGAISKGADCRTIRLAKCQINRCTACEYCQTKEEYTCVFEDKDDFENVISQIKDADIVLFATPVYVFGALHHIMVKGINKVAKGAGGVTTN